MNENLNLYKILKDCPKGTKFWTSIWGYVYFQEVDINSPVVVSVDKEGNVYHVLFHNGKAYDNEDSECVIFPSKSQRDWSKFKVPTKVFNFKDFKPFDKVLTRDGKNCKWSPNIFGMFEKRSNKYVAVGIGSLFTWEMCIPYNDETKHLVGTSDDCDGCYKWWEG